MSEESEPKKKAARKITRKRTSKKAAKKAAPESAEDQLSLTDAAPTVLPGESLSVTPKVETESAPVETSEASAEKSAQSDAEDKQRKQPKSRVRDARRETADEPATESGEPLIKEVTEENAKVDPQEQAEGKGRDKRRDNRDERDDRDDQKGGRNRRGRNRGRREDGPIQPRPEVDHEKMAKKAWKIFQSEVTEEGLALLDDKGLREYARSSFNAARIFLEEEQKVK